MTAVYSRADVLARAARSLLPAPPPHGMQATTNMNVKARRIPEGIKPKHAAVLVGLITHGDDLTVLLTQRTAHLSKHARPDSPFRRTPR